MNEKRRMNKRNENKRNKIKNKYEMKELYYYSSHKNDMKK